MPEEEKARIVKFFENVNDIPFPGWVKKNILTAIGKGLGNLIVAGFQVPTAWLDSITADIKGKSKGKELVRAAAAKQVASLFKTDSELANRAIEYFAHDMINRQSNREDVAVHFISQLNSSEVNTENEKEVEEDWLTIFWSIAETKSNDEIKLILGKVLAKETTAPNSISPRTLQLLPILTKEIGKAFQSLCNHSIKEEHLVFVLDSESQRSGKDYELSESGISFHQLSELEGAGLIRTADPIGVNMVPGDGPFEDGDFAGIKIKFNFSEGVNIIDFTKAGKELRDLMDLQPNEKYKEFLLSLGDSKFQIVA